MSHDSFDPDQLEAAVARIRELKARLPEEAVHLLAREVLDRVSSEVDIDPGASLQVSRRIDRLARALLSPDLGPVYALIDRLKDRGTPTHEIYMIYLAGAARRLGEMWENDAVSFTDVTLATSRIYSVVQHLRELRRRSGARHVQSVTLALVPGEQHTLGVQMAAELFREAGWDVQVLLETDHDSLVEAVTESGCLVIGVSASQSSQAASLARLVIALRIAEPDLRIMVSGRITQTDLDLVRRIEPDSICNAFPEAISELERLAAEVAASP